MRHSARAALERSAIAMLLAGCTGWPATGCAQDNRVTLSADGATLTGTSGGAGGSVGYLQQVGPDALLGLAGEYQRLAGAYWAFGSLNAAFSHALSGRARWNVHADAHEGDGNTGTSAVRRGHSFRYAIEAGGLGVTTPAGFAVDAEERQFDVQSSHGSLPKVTLSQSWGRHWLTTIAYARSAGGNLDTEYGMARIDFYGRGFGLLGGASVGRVTPAVVNLAGVLQPQAKHLSEPFLGISKSIRRVDLTLLGDDFRLAGITHFTVTLNLVVHVP
jgi:hypothetical protein